MYFTASPAKPLLRVPLDRASFSTATSQLQAFRALAGACAVVSEAGGFGSLVTVTVVTFRGAVVVGWTLVLVAGAVLVAGVVVEDGAFGLCAVPTDVFFAFLPFDPVLPIMTATSITTATSPATQGNLLCQVELRPPAECDGDDAGGVVILSLLPGIW